jgi:hypothetical protein
MKKTVLLLALTLGWSLEALGSEFSAKSDVRVCAEIEFWDGKCSVPRAEQLANVIFTKADVRIAWQNVGAQEKRHTCSASQDRQINVRLGTGTPASFHPGALAFAQVDSGLFIQVFFDRIVQVATHNGEGRVLAHVLVHEITHVIEGGSRHSEKGMMMSKWSSFEIMQMNFKPLSFTPEDIQLIHLGLARCSRGLR